MERKVSRRDLQWQEKYEQMKVYITERLALLRALSEMRDLQENGGMLFRISTAQTGNQDK